MFLHQAGVEVNKEFPVGLSTLSEAVGNTDVSVFGSVSKAMWELVGGGCPLQTSGDCKGESLQACEGCYFTVSCFMASFSERNDTKDLQYSECGSLLIKQTPLSVNR